MSYGAEYWHYAAKSPHFTVDVPDGSGICPTRLPPQHLLRFLCRHRPLLFLYLLLSLLPLRLLTSSAVKAFKNFTTSAMCPRYRPFVSMASTPGFRSTAKGSLAEEVPVLCPERWIPRRAWATSSACVLRNATP